MRFTGHTHNRKSKRKRKGIKNAFEETLAEKLLNLKAQRVPNKMNSNELQMKTNCNQNSKS